MRLSKWLLAIVPIHRPLAVSVSVVPRFKNQSVHGRCRWYSFNRTNHSPDNRIHHQPPPPLCSSIIAIAHTTDPTAPSKEPAEEFVCEHNATGLLPIVGTPSQIDTLRHALYDGRWISAETTLSGLTTVDFIDSGGHGEQVVYLPDRLEFVPVTENNNLRRERVGEKAAGVKKVLVVKVTDVNGMFSSLVFFRVSYIWYHLTLGTYNFQSSKTTTTTRILCRTSPSWPSSNHIQ